MTESAPVSSAVRPEPGIMITSFFVWKTSRRASVVGSSTPSSKLRSYWIDGGWFIAWMTRNGSSVGPGIMRTGRVWHWAQLIVTGSSFVAGILACGSGGDALGVAQDEVEITRVDEETRPLTQNEHGVAPPQRVEEQRHAAADREIPEG